MRFALDPALDVVLAARGGYGITRLLPRLDFAAIKAGRPLIAGYSDFTAFQSALLAKTGALTWAGPALGEDLGAEQPDDIMEACLDDMLSAVGEGAGWRLSRATAQALQSRKPGVWARDAVLWGGNLSMLAFLIFARPAGESASPSMSFTIFDRSRILPFLSTIPGFSRPAEPKRTSFMGFPFVWI